MQANYWGTLAINSSAAGLYLPDKSRTSYIQNILRLKRIGYNGTKTISKNRKIWHIIATLLHHYTEYMCIVVHWPANLLVTLGPWVYQGWELSVDYCWVSVPSNLGGVQMNVGLEHGSGCFPDLEWQCWVDHSAVTNRAHGKHLLALLQLYTQI